jgi:cytochrome P450
VVAGVDGDGDLVPRSLALTTVGTKPPDELREHRERIPDFLEEVLRCESPVKTDFRLTRRSTNVGGVDI